MSAAGFYGIVSDHLLDLVVAAAPAFSSIFNGPVISCLRAGFPSDFQDLIDDDAYRERLESNFDFLSLLGSLTLGWLNFTFNLLQSKSVGFDAAHDSWKQGFGFVLIALLWLLAFVPIIALYTHGPAIFCEWTPTKKSCWKFAPVGMVVLQIVILAVLESQSVAFQPDVPESAAPQSASVQPTITSSTPNEPSSTSTSANPPVLSSQAE